MQTQKQENVHMSNPHDNPMSNPYENQIGGDHYKKYKTA